jgi:MarR family transcriptional regulator, organic hydroperoxide resistance regulator
MSSQRRDHLLGRLTQAAQRAATDGILFHQAVADRLGLHVTDLRCLNILLELGPVSAGEIVKRTGLTTGAITRMLDRLEQAGYVRREPHQSDRRRVTIHLVPEQAARITPLYAGMAAAWTEAIGDYDDHQLEAFLELFSRLHDLTQREITRLQDAPSGSRIR